MHGQRPGTRLALALALLAAAGAPAAAQRGGQARQLPAVAADEHAYVAAMEALENYRTCNVRRGRAGELQALAAELAAIESLARAKGLGPVLQRVQEEHLRMLAVTSRMWVACAGGPEGALAAARQALAAFRTWAERTPAHRLTRAELDAETTREVAAREDAFAAAMTERDATAIAGILAPGAEVVRDGGRAYAIDRMLPGEARMNLIRYRTTERRVAVGDGTATVTGIAEIIRSTAGPMVTERFRYRASWRRLDGTWRLAGLLMDSEGQ
ncbi:MAG: nuclear transport factor 2 family protein [Sphingomonadaceae bacterium]|nr:nuclear transport factor 2 family protein [Sphingomonadaceae bacterium]